MKPLALVLLLTTGCATYVIRDPVTEEEIIRMTKEGVSPDDIIRRIDQSRTVYIMDAKDVIKLHDQGVDERVINFMLETQKRDIERRAHHHHYYHDPYYYPPVHFGFGWYF